MKTQVGKILFRLGKTGQKDVAFVVPIAPQTKLKFLYKQSNLQDLFCKVSSSQDIFKDASNNA